ncbi:MAG TPA: ATP-binding protein, partial [Hyalangium sp.]|nr:ATP-binding protein [Hyalangium sp.]
PGLLLDPYRGFSNVSMPSWESAEVSLRYPDLLTEIDGKPLPQTVTEFPSRDAYALMAESHRSGARQVSLTFVRDTGERLSVHRELRTLTADELGFFFGFYAVVAFFLLWTGGVVLLLAGRREGGRAYAGWTVAAFLLFITFFDYHTTTRLTSWFSLAGVGFDFCFLWMAYAFPQPPRRFRRVLRAALVGAACFSLYVLARLVWAPLSPHTAALRMLVTQGMLLSMAVLVGSILLRLRGSTGRARAELRSASWGLVATPVLLIVGLFAGLAVGSGIFHLFVPFLIPLIPLSVGFALVRHNILETNAVFTRRLLVGPISIASLGGALLAWLALRGLVREGVEAWLPTLLSLPVLVVCLVAASRVSNRLFFAAASQFRPTIEQLSDHLATLQEGDAIRQAVEAAVGRWLSATGPVRVIEPRDLLQVPRLPSDGSERLMAGEYVWTQESPWHRMLAMPMRSLGVLRGVLLLPPKNQAALYTSEDLTLLATIASLGAVALHHAEALRELTALRRSQVEATRDEKRFAMGLLGAEISHEVAYPLNFFRYLLKNSARGLPLDPQDVEIGSEEVARLERMLVALRKLKPPAPQLTAVQVRGPLKRALDLIRESLEDKRIRVEVEVPPELELTADADMVLQLFANLLRNAVQAVEPGGSVGVRCLTEAQSLRIEVWDSGPGVPEELRSSIWNPWVTTREGGSGLGLAVTQRIVRSMGWTISLERKEGRTCFCIQVPPSRVEPPNGRRPEQAQKLAALEVETAETAKGGPVHHRASPRPYR